IVGTRLEAEDLVTRRPVERLVEVACPVRSTGGLVRGIRSRLERCARHDAGRLVLPVPVAGGAAEYRNDDIGAESTDYRDDIREHTVAWPVREGLLRALGEAVIVRAREKLSGAVEPPG